MRNVLIVMMLLVSGNVMAQGVGDKKGAGEKKIAKPSKSQPQEEKPIYLDMSGKDEPESEFPTVSKKGSL